MVVVDPGALDIAAAVAIPSAIELATRASKPVGTIGGHDRMRGRCDSLAMANEIKCVTFAAVASG